MLEEIHRDALAISQGKHRVSLNVEYDGDLVGSRDELHSAFSNLVTNALRYTPEGGSVTLTWQLQGETPVFTVRDTGIGIEAHYIPRLTERFYRVDHSRSRASGGTGLGLAIVKHIVNRHQAQLRIQSVLDQGSEFSVVFPVARALAPRPVCCE